MSARRELTIDPTLVVRFRKLSTFLWPALLRHPRVTATSPVKKTFEHLRFFKLLSVDPLSFCSVDNKLRLGKSELFSTILDCKYFFCKIAYLLEPVLSNPPVLYSMTISYYLHLTFP